MLPPRKLPRGWKRSLGNDERRAGLPPGDPGACRADPCFHKSRQFLAKHKTKLGTCETFAVMVASMDKVRGRTVIFWKTAAK
jgi:hypothetical protein